MSPLTAPHALYASYNGPLYQVLRQSDGKTMDIGIVPPASSPSTTSRGDMPTRPRKMRFVPTSHC